MAFLHGGPCGSFWSWPESWSRADKIAPQFWCQTLAVCEPLDGSASVDAGANGSTVQGCFLKMPNLGVNSQDFFTLGRFSIGVWLRVPGVKVSVWGNQAWVQSLRFYGFISALSCRTSIDFSINLRAFRNTSKNILSVSLPVLVFCKEG